MRKILFAIFLIVLSANTLRAEPIFERYINWIVNNSELVYNQETLPTIQRVSSDFLQILFYGDTVVAQAEFNNHYLPEVIALYDDRNNQIIVSHETDLSDFANHHIIVHELVHFLQKINNVTYDCVGMLEPQAYRLQEKWQDEVNHPAERPDMLFVILIELACINPLL
jgi:predicted Zn-dependent protease with MMP-like domain